MKHTALLVFAIICLLLPACTLARAAENADAAVVVANEVKRRIELIDQNQDGKIGWQEALYGLLGLGVVGGAVAKSLSGKVATAHARIDKTKGEVDELYDEVRPPNSLLNAPSK